MAEEKKARKSLLKRQGLWLKEAKSDVKKITWPSAKKVRNNTLIVLGSMAVMSALVFALDSLITLFFSRVLGIG